MLWFAKAEKVIDAQVLGLPAAGSVGKVKPRALLRHQREHAVRIRRRLPHRLNSESYIWRYIGESELKCDQN